MKNRAAAVVLRLLGILILLAVIITCLPASVPRLLGYEVYNVVSGSMEPAISVGSAIYVEDCEPGTLSEGDVAAFYVEGEVIAHRVVLNDSDNQRLYTKGDANEASDLNPVAYDMVIGRVSYVVPYLGALLVLYTSTQGKLSVLGFLAAGLLLCYLARRLEPEKTHREQAKDNKLQRRYRRLVAVMVLLGVILLIVIGVIVAVLWRYHKENQTYEAARESYVTEQIADTDTQETEQQCPISVDFEALQALNPEIVAWIYCEDTVINYPVCYSGDDSYYLTHAYDLSESRSGAIFIEEANETDWSDANYILYGHHMKNQTMFATLSDWAEQAYYDEHPVMWLLTPTQTYRVDLFAGYTTPAGSDTYAIYRSNGTQLDEYLQSAVAQSDFTSEVAVSGNEGTYIVLSTCEYSFQNARYVLHGRLTATEE